MEEMHAQHSEAWELSSLHQGSIRPRCFRVTHKEDVGTLLPIHPEQTGPFRGGGTELSRVAHGSASP